METLLSRTWLWCHNAGVYNNIEALHAKSDYTQVEALEYMGIRNAIMVVYGGKPEPPFAPLQEKVKRMDNVVWSIIGDSSSKRNQEKTDIDEVISLSKNYSNVTGGIMDDFFQVNANSSRLEQLSGQMHSAGLPLWVVLYEHELPKAEQYNISELMPFCDVITFWTWNAHHLVNLKANMAKVKELAPGKRIVLGCYLWDFGSGEEISAENMALQLEQGKEWLLDGTIHDMILLGSPLFGMNLPAVEQAKNWLSENGNTIIK